MVHGLEMPAECGSACDKLAILPTVSPEGSSSEGPLAYSPRRQAVLS